MSSIISIVISLISSTVVKFLSQFLLTLREGFKYLNGLRQDRKEKESKKELDEYKKKMVDVVDNGTIEDLLDLRR